MAVLDAWLTVLREAQRVSAAITIVSHIEIGTGTTPVTGADTALETAVIRNTTVNSAVGTDIVSYVAEFSQAEANGSYITEAGAVNAGTAGTFSTRKVFPAFLKSSNYDLKVSVFVKQENNI